MATAYQAGATPVFLARIENSEAGGYLLPSQVSSASYSIKQTLSDGESPSTEDKTFHTNQSVPMSAFLETPICDQHWTEDNTGYNFKFTPNTREHPAFPYPGVYEIAFKVVPVIGNPIAWKRKLRFL